MILLCHISIWYYFEKDILNSVHVLWWQSHDKLSDGSVMIGLPNRTNNTDISMAIKHQIFHFVAHSIGSQKCINHFAKALKSHHLRIFNCTCFHYFYTKFLRWVENGYLSTEDDQKQEQRKRFEVLNYKRYLHLRQECHISVTKFSYALICVGECSSLAVTNHCFGCEFN